MKAVTLLCAIVFSYNCYSQNQWEQCSNGPCNYFVKSFIETPNFLLASGTCVSIDSGATWNILNGGRFAFCLKETNAGIFAGSDTAIYFSVNGGNSWSTSYLTSGQWNFIYDMAVSNDTVFAATRASGVLMSPDNGSTWTSLNAGLPGDSTRAILAKDNNLFIGLLNWGIYKSNDAGNNWISANNGIPVNTTISSIVADGQRIYAAAGNVIYISADDGATWFPSPGSPGAINKPEVVGNSVLAGCFTLTGAGGVFRSLDQGQSWQNFNNGLPTGCAYGISGIYTGSFYVYLGMESQCGSIYRMEKTQVATSINNEINTLDPYFISPNPFSNEIEIANNTNEMSTILLFDITSRLVLNETFQNNLILNTSQLGKGMYFYTVSAGSKLVYTGKIVKLL